MNDESRQLFTLSRCTQNKDCARSICHDESGSTLLAVIIGISLVMVFGLAYADAYVILRRNQAKIDFLNTVAQIQLTIANTVNDSNSWQRTIADSIHNGSMSCLTSLSCAVAVPPTSFVLWPAGENSFASTSTSVYDGTSATAGFTLNGIACTTFSLSGDDTCPIHVTMTWQTGGCSPTPCQPQVDITADIQYRPLSRSAVGTIDESHYALTFDQKSNSSDDACASPVPPDELAACSPPAYSNDTLICTSAGYRCGQVFH